MYTRKGTQMHFPGITFSQKTSTEDDFWRQKGSSGAIQAFRQLTTTQRKGGRKVAALPGGKLQPLFRNHSNPSALEGLTQNRNVLPNITAGGMDGSNPLKHIIQGSMENLPEMTPATVKVYLCSNGEDTKRERMFLLKHAVPELQQHCSQLGLYFQLVDLHWAAPSDDTIDGRRQTRHFEIEDCRRNSLGPNFVLLLGQKYGRTLLPSSVSEVTFAALSATLSDFSLEVLHQIYVKDENVEPPVYVLQNLQDVGDETILGNLAESLSELMEVSEKVLELPMSGLEEDIGYGILNTTDPRQSCLCYHREFRELSTKLDSDIACSFIDTTTNDLGVTSTNETSLSRLKTLSELIAEHLGVGNCRSYYLNWNTDDLEEDQEFESYLQKLGEDFIKDMKNLIDLGYKQASRELSAKKKKVPTATLR